MVFPLKSGTVVCPECHFEGKPTVKKSEFGFWAMFIVLLAVSFFWLFWPLFLASLVVLCWLLLKRANKVCPRCRFEIPNPERQGRGRE